MPTYNIQPNPVSPGGEEQNMSYQQIMPILHGLEPGSVGSAGSAFEELGKTLDAVAGRLRDTAMKLASDNSWRGAAAQAAMNRFQQLHDQAAQLAAQAHTTANSVNWIGNEVLPKFRQIPSPQVMSKSQADSIMGTVVDMPGMGSLGGTVLGAMGIGPDGQAKADNAARGYLAALNGHLASAPFPSSISSPHATNIGAGNPGAPSGGGGGGGIGGGLASGHGGTGGSGSSGAPGGAPMPGYTPPAGAGHFNPAKLPGGTPSASLQGYAPPSGGGTGSPFGAGSPGGLNVNGGGSANPFSRMPTPMPAGGFGKGGLPGAGSIPGESSLPDTPTAGGAGASAADGAAGEAAGANAARAGAAEGEGMGMTGMPMTGSGGQQDKERQRQAWMHEDDDIWGLPQDSMGSVIE